MHDQRHQRPTARATTEGHPEETQALAWSGTVLLDDELDGAAGGHCTGEEIPS